MSEIYIALSIIGAAITFFLLLHAHRKDVRYKNFINEYNIIKKTKSDLDIIASEARGYY